MNKGTTMRITPLPSRALLAVTLAALCCAAAAQAPVWPTKPVKIINSFPPGGPSDTIARSVSVRRELGVAGIGMCLACLAACSPERRPKTSVSRSELAPSLLPPCTETQATSPAA